MRTLRPITAGAAAATVALSMAACSSSNGGSANTSSQPKSNVVAGKTTTPPGSKALSSLTWYGDYRPVYSLDPIKNADYPEETILPNVCTSLVQLDSSYNIKPSLASSWKQVDPTTLVFTLRKGVKFADGSPLTTTDVVFSLKRNMDPALASSFSDAYSRVKSITATGADEVTVTFKRPDNTFIYGAAGVSGAILSKKYTQQKGKAFGSPKGGVLCAGPYTVASYDGTHDLTLKANPNYWDTAHKPKAAKVTFVFARDPGALVNAISAGSIQGAFDIPPTDLDSLRKSTKGKLLIGGATSSPQSVGIIPSSVNNGPLADKRVRRAIGLAVDRSALAKKVWGGAAQPLYSFAGPGMFGPATSKLQPAYDKLVRSPDLAKAKKLVAAAGATGKVVRLAYPSDIDFETTLATYVQQVGKQIGLDVKLVGQPSSQFGNLFVDAGARKKVDAFMTINYLEFPSPAAMIQSFATPEGFQNYEGYDNPALTTLIHQAFATSSVPGQAKLINRAQAILGEDQPWIPLLAPQMTLFMAKGITGAPLTFNFMSSPWLTQVGGS